LTDHRPSRAELALFASRAGLHTDPIYKLILPKR
jgi:hypothetical protein